ncbi:MAG: thioredoxin family protein, partial [Bacteroidota bacterium]
MNLLHKLSLLSLSLFLTLGISAQGIEFFHGSWEEALAKASAEDKLIFVDAYASWCGPCKKMAANVFPKKEVGDYFNTNFINVKYDMEKEESTEFRETHSVRAFPTLLFINGKNEVVHKTVGGKQVKTLLTEANSALAKMDDIPAMAAAWEEGDRSSKLAFRYIRALVRQGTPHAKITNDYLRSQQDLTTEDNLNILLTAATTADSRIFDLLVK